MTLEDDFKTSIPRYSVPRNTICI